MHHLSKLKKKVIFIKLKKNSEIRIQESESISGGFKPNYSDATLADSKKAALSASRTKFILLAVAGRCSRF